MFYLKARGHRTVLLTPAHSMSGPEGPNPMRHAPARSLRRAVHSLAVVCLLGAFSVPQGAAGQIGNVGKKARDAAGRAMGGQQQGEAVQFDNVTLELTPARLDQLIKGLRARRAALDGRGGEPSVSALRAQRDAASNAASELRSSNGRDIDTYRDRAYQVKYCRDEAFNEKRNAREEASRNRIMSDPVLLQKFMELSQRAAEAQQRSDTAELLRIQAEADNLYGKPTKADSADVDRKCGRSPTPPPALARLDSLQALEARFGERLRQREREADSLAVAGSGLTTEQMAMGEERAQMYLTQVETESAHIGFTKTEVAALDARREELEDLL